MTDIPALIARVLAPGYCQYDDDLECYSDAQDLATALEATMAENERRREEVRLAQCPNPRDPEHAGHCETCSGLSVARTRRLHDLEAENERLREALRTVAVTGVPGGSICAKRGDDHKCGWCRGMWTPCPVAAARAALEGTR